MTLYGLIDPRYADVAGIGITLTIIVVSFIGLGLFSWLLGKICNRFLNGDVFNKGKR